MIAVLPLLVQFASALPGESFVRQQTRVINHLVETSSGATLPAQDFKRHSVNATFTDGDKSYAISVYQIEPGDMIYFLVFTKEITAQNGNKTEHRSSVQAYRLAEDLKSVERRELNGISTTTLHADGSSTTVFENERYAHGASSVTRTSPWRTGGHMTVTEFFNTNENAGVDTTITGARYTVFSLPITLQVFRTRLPPALTDLFETFRSIHLLALKSHDARLNNERERLWDSLTSETVPAPTPVAPPRPVANSRETQTRQTAKPRRLVPMRRGSLFGPF